MRMTAKELIAEARVTAPTLPPSAAKLMTALADRLDVQFVALCESRNEAKQLAGENALMKSAIKTHSESVHFCVGCGKDDPCSNDDVCYALEETPATDAFLASLRAEGAANAIPDGYVLMPKQIHLDADAVECICSQGGDGGFAYGDFTDVILWVGEVENDDGSKTHGLNVSSADYPEEGSINLSEFADQHRSKSDAAAKSTSGESQRSISMAALLPRIPAR